MSEMVITELATILATPGDPDWEVLLKNTFDQEIHPHRKQGFLLSREALRIALESQGHTPTISDLNVLQHRSLARFTDLTLSLSHTPLVGAAVIADKGTHPAVGIDVEARSRRVKDTIIERISHPRDEKFTGLELWCLKEATFKALMNTGRFERPVEFSSLEIRKDDWLHSPSGTTGRWELRPSTEYVVGLAYLGT
ncbi:MAG TPA: 4'-phosphopantetheinyl transferase superfamily protein [Bacteriovoracaceae bacterium]|nr:4'-phosphopantetheinyl transferase superfamily protein [Bacteriovoracaceae bacterium]